MLGFIICKMEVGAFGFKAIGVLPLTAAAACCGDEVYFDVAVIFASLSIAQKYS
jgi:hypothetical protein